MELVKLIDAASAISGSDGKLARHLEVSPGNVSDWRHGRRPCPIDCVADMAAIAGLPVSRVVEEALIERNAGTPRGERLAKALGKALAGVVATLCIFGTAVPDARAAASSEQVRIFPLQNRLRRIWEMLNLTLHRNAKLA